MRRGAPTTKRGRSPAAALALFVLAGCGGGSGGRAGAICERDDACRAGLACLDGICAPALQDPGGEGPSAGGPVRVFAVGFQPRLQDAVSQDSFRNAIRAVVDRDVVPSLATDRPNLLVFPENTGLHAAFIGRRGSAARAAGDLAEGFFLLSNAYGEAGRYYLEQFGASGPVGRIVLLSVTDTVRRALDHTFATMARELGAYVAVTANVSDADCVTDPELIRILVDEDAPDRSCAWRASERVPNQTFVYGPDGSLLEVIEKEYLVPDEEDVLGLHYGPLGRGTMELPFGACASLISKDAFMPDVLDRYALDDVALVLQPEAWQGYADPHGEHGDWGPDVVKESGWAHVMRYPEFRASVLPCLSGNLLDLAFDCQSAVIVDAPLFAGRGAFIGQEPDVGLARVAPWVVEDGTGTIEERRMRLRDVGNRLLPGSGDPLQNAYAPGTVFHDLDLGAPFPVVAPASGAVAPSESGEQRHPDAVALDDGTLLVVWEDTRLGTSRLYGARVTAGATGEARMRAPSDGDVRTPRLAAHDGAVHLVYQDEDGTGRRIVRYARSEDGGRSFLAPIALERVTMSYVPDVAVDAATGDVHVVWAQLAVGPYRIVHARVGADGTVDGPRPLEPAPDPTYDTRQNRWSPAVAAHGGTVLVAWADFRSYRWEIWGAVSRDGGTTFEEAVRLDDADVPWETIHSDPELVAAEDGALYLAWTDLRVRRPDHDVRLRRLDPAALPGSEPSRSLATTDAGGRPQWRPSLALRSGEPAVVWQDFRDGVNRLRAGGAADDVAIVTGDAESFNPRLAVRPDGSAAVVFESVATGRRRVHLVELP